MVCFTKKYSYQTKVTDPDINPINCFLPPSKAIYAGWWYGTLLPETDIKYFTTMEFQEGEKNHLVSVHPNELAITTPQKNTLKSVEYMEYKISFSNLLKTIMCIRNQHSASSFYYFFFLIKARETEQNRQLKILSSKLSCQWKKWKTPVLYQRGICIWLMAPKLEA